MATFEDVHAGDVVLGHDGQLWGVAAKATEPQLTVVLVNGDQRLIARPPFGTHIEIIEPSDVSPEFAAWLTLTTALGPVDIISESWEV